MEPNLRSMKHDSKRVLKYSRKWDSKGDWPTPLMGMTYADYREKYHGSATVNVFKVTKVSPREGPCKTQMSEVVSEALSHR
jgi:hypothetical protein